MSSVTPSPNIAAPTPEPQDPARVLRVSMRVAVALLMSGDQTDDVEAASVAVASAYGLNTVQAAVTFSTITISHDTPGTNRPTTLLHIVKDRTSDFTRLASVSSLVRRIQEEPLPLETAEAELDDLDRLRPVYNQAISFVAPGVSAAASTLVFAGSAFDAVVTLGIALILQPALAVLDRATIPPFFRLVFGAFATTALVGLLVGLDVPIIGGLVLTGSLLRFLPGYALVSGFRDLIGQSMISGTARLAEALLLGAGVAGGTAIGLGLAGLFGVHLSLLTAGGVNWGFLVTLPAAFVAVGAFAVRLGAPPSAIVAASLLGAFAWWMNGALAGPGPATIDPTLATLAASVVIGIVGRLLAGREHGAAALWVVPAVLLLLPGLQIVSAMLAPTNDLRIAGMLAAGGTAFLLGTGVASGDIIVLTARRLRDRVVDPAVDAMSEGIDVLVVTPVEHALERLHGRRATDAGRSTKEQDDLGD